MTEAPPLACLVATDLSARSDRALVRAFRIAGRGEGRVIVLHVVEKEYPRSISSTLIGDLESELRRQIQAMPESSGVAWKVMIRQGRDYEAIAEAARTQAIDLLLLGGRRVPKLNDQFFSSTAQRVVRRSPAPVLIVKGPYRGPYGIGLAAVDDSRVSQEAVRFALESFPELLVTAFHAADVADPRGPVTDALNRIGGFPKRGEVLEVQGDATAVMDELVRDRRPDLLVCGYPRSARSFFLGEDLPGHAMLSIDRDLLIMPEM